MMKSSGKSETKYIVVTGGVLSGLGKGITASSIGLLLRELGFKVTAIKIDPYINCDAGTMNPYQHGEVFVLSDGTEVDLDLGNYERFLDIEMTGDNNITTGKVYKSVIDKERAGKYLGKTVQIIPHVTNEIKEMIRRVEHDSGADIVIIEAGGTVGDIESMPFLEALRELHSSLGDERMMFIHTTLVPIIGVVGEQKTKPTQHSVKELRGIGILPRAIVCRGSEPITKNVREKIALFCDVDKEAVVSAYDLDTIYAVPLLLHKQKFTHFIVKSLNLKGKKKLNLGRWKHYVEGARERDKKIKIALIGKYTHLKDSYISHEKALEHAGIQAGVKVDIKWLEAQDLLDLKKDELSKVFEDVHGILIPGGFGYRGALGKMVAAKYARENKVPFLGVCFGFQLAVIEFCRNVLGIKDANSAEFEEEAGREFKNKVIDLLPEQRDVEDMGATMRLGDSKVIVAKDTKARGLYKRKTIVERHRHRYEVNLDYREKIDEGGMIFSGESKDGKKMEILELSGHPYYMASQFHPEFRSRPRKPVPLFKGLIRAAVTNRGDLKKV